MSNTKQQIEEVLNETLLIWKQDYPKPDGNHSLLMDEYFDRLEKSKHNLLEAIDRLVTEAKQDVLKELVEWYEYALSVDDTSFDWYRAVKALMVSKDHKKPFSQLGKEE